MSFQYDVTMINIYKSPREARAKNNRLNVYKSGFTLLEVLMVIGILAILATIVLVAINPARQFKIARDSQRAANVTAILNAVGQNMADHSGAFVCEGQITEMPSSETNMASSDGFDVARCIVPDYISALPYDPIKDTAHYTDDTDYDTGYLVLADADGRVTVSAEGELASSSISVTR